MNHRITAAALCCLLLASCASPVDRDWRESYDAFDHMERSR